LTDQHAHMFTIYIFSIVHNTFRSRSWHTSCRHLLHRTEQTCEWSHVE